MNGTKERHLTRVLIVDDSAALRHEVRDLLEGIGYESVLTVTDAERALEVLRATPDVGGVITGTKIPGIGGLGLVRELRANDLWQRLPVLVMIEPGDEAAITLASTLGASGYIEKPIRIEILRKKLLFILAPRLTEMVG
jgi:DNA-binding response OmpR family regulator